MYEIYNLDYQQAGSLLTPPDKRNTRWLAFLNACLTPIQWLRDLIFSDYAGSSSSLAYVLGTTYNLGDRVKYTDFAIYELINALPAFATGTATGTNTYTVSITGISEYAQGQYYVINFANSNTAAATLNVNSLGAITINLTNTTIKGGNFMALYYNGSSFDLVNIDPGNTNYWYKVLDNFIGLRERMRYNSQQQLLEYALNRYFGTNYAPPNFYSSGDYTPKSAIYIERNSVDTDGFIIGNSEQATAIINATDLLYFNNCIGTSYIVIAQDNFIIHVPDELANNLGLGDYTNVVKTFADQYVVYGMIYDVKKYP